MKISTPSDIAYSNAVKQVQSAKGSRDAIKRMTQRQPWATLLTPEIAAFIERRDSAFLGTASREGQPYIQHRGGPAGFLHVLDERTIGFADLAGNRQYITLGNLSENPSAFLFLIDYGTRRRVKFWGTAQVVENDLDLIERLRPGARARAERAVLFEVATWDINCPSHIPMLVDAASAAVAIERRDARIVELETRLARTESQTFPTTQGGSAPGDRNR